MSDNAKIKDPAPILALLLTALAAPAAELAITPAQLAAQFAHTKFNLRAELQAPRALVTQFSPQEPFTFMPPTPLRSAAATPLTAATTMNPTRKKNLPVHLVFTPTFTLPIHAGEIRQHGVTPLLIKSIRAQMAAAHVNHPAAAL